MLICINLQAVVLHLLLHRRRQRLGAVSWTFVASSFTSLEIEFIQSCVLCALSACLAQEGLLTGNNNNNKHNHNNKHTHNHNHNNNNNNHSHNHNHNQCPCSLLLLLFRESSWGPRPLAALHCLHFCCSWFWEWFLLSQLYFLLRWRRQIITSDEKLGFYVQASESMPPMCNFKLCHLNRLMHAALRMNKGWCAFIRQGGLAQLGKNHCVVLVPLHKHQVKLHLFIPVFLLCIRLGYFSWCKEAVVDPPEPVRPPQEAAAPPDSALLSAAACRTWIETKSQDTIWISKLCLSFFPGTWVGIVSKFLAQRHQQLLQTARRVRTVMCGFLVRCF